MAILVERSREAPPPEPAPTTSEHRTDIDALRALAVVLVVLFHMGAPRFGAGFIGVDVFFVVSGFLITGLLATELDRSGRIALGRFWARRIRRLLPAAAFVVVSVLAFAWLAGSPLRWSYLSRTAAATVTYWSNLFFAGQSSDYFAADVKANPLLHFWSLSVEEQYYVVWPLLLALVGLRTRHREPAARRRVLLATVAAMTGLSLAYSLVASAGSPITAYYSPASRAWEFGAGALLAVVAARRSSSARGGPASRLVPGGAPIASAVALAGVALLAVSLLVIHPDTPFPAPIGVLPVAGTLAFLAAAVPAAAPLGRLLALAPIQYVGRLSYSWYLWHWPFLVLGQQYLRSEGRATRVLLVVASLIAASATHHLIENPIRYSRRLRGLPASYALGAAVMAVSLIASLGLHAAAQARRDDPRLAALITARTVPWEPRLAGFNCARSDVARLRADCTFGDVASPRTILVLGDSNADQWLPALDEIGRNRGYAVTLRVRGGCPAVPVRSADAIDAPACTQLQAETRQVIDQIQPALVVVAMVSQYAENTVEPSGAATTAERRQELWTAATRQFLTETTAGRQVAWIEPIPLLPADPIDCLATRSEASCEAPFTDVTRLPTVLRDWTAQAVAAVPGPLAPRIFDPVPLVCPDGACPLIAPDGTVIYRDRTHLSPKAAADLTPALDQFLAPQLPLT